MPIFSKSAEARHPSRKEKRHSEAQRSVEIATRTAIRQGELKKMNTLGLYSLRTKDSSFGVPFCAASDSMALEVSKQILPLANVYRVGSFCLLDGKCLALSRPLILLDK